MVAVAARKRQDTLRGIHALFMAMASILAISTTITQWLLWESHHDTLAAEGASDIALATWAQANASELSWFYTFLLCLCSCGIHSNFRMAFNLACMAVTACAVSSYLMWHQHLSLVSILTRAVVYLCGCVVPVVSGCYRAERQDRRHFLDRILLEERSRLLEQLSKQERRVIEAETRADAEHNLVSKSPV
jgi:hypothetical protein